MNLNDAKKHFPLVVEQANQNFNEISTKYPGVIQQIESMAIELVDIKLSKNAKLTMLRKLIDGLNVLIVQNIACSKGCSSCCYMATLTFSIEVENISTQVKIKPKKFKGIFKNLNDEKLANIQHTIQGVPCTFLKNNECSIYDIRPLACRLHHNLSNSPQMCDTSLDSETTCIPKIDLPLFQQAMVIMFGDRGDSMGDIREAFPTSAKSIYNSKT